MNKLTRKMALFGKGRKAVVNFIDIDNDLANIGTSGELEGNKDTPIEFDSGSKIKELEDKGYVLVENKFDPNGKKPLFGDDEETPYEISFRHGHEVVDVDNPGFGFSKEQLQKIGTQTVHYTGAAGRSPQDNVSHIVFNHTIEVDKVTHKMIEDKGWRPESQCHLMIGTPTIPSYIPDETVVGGELVNVDDPDREYTVEYDINKDPSTDEQSAIIKFVDITDDNREIVSDKLTGMPNTPIEYDPQTKIDELNEKGYSLVNNGFNPGGEVQFYLNSDDVVPTFIITMKHELAQVNVDHPNDKVKPTEYHQETTFAVDFEGAGEKTPVNNVQNAIWNRSITVIAPTGQIIENGKYTTDWVVDPDSFHDVKVPVVPGYHTDVKVVKAQPITREDRIVNVNYVENGRIIPVDENGDPIEGADQPVFTTLKTDPTKVMPDEIVPTVEGYSSDLMTVTPHQPDKDLKVTYKADTKSDVLVIPVGKNKFKDQDEKENMANQENQPEVVGSNVIKPEKVENQDEPKENTEAPAAVATPVEAQPIQETNIERPAAVAQNVPNDVESQVSDTASAVEPHDQVAIINFIDIDKNGAQLTSSGPLVGKPGESINDLYSTEIPLKAIEDAGYEIVFNNFDREGVVQRFDNNDLMTQIFTIGVRKKRTPEEKAAEDAKQKQIENKEKQVSAPTHIRNEYVPAAMRNPALPSRYDHFIPQADRIRPTERERERQAIRDHNTSTAAMVLGVAATLISLIGLTGKRK